MHFPVAPAGIVPREAGAAGLGFDSDAAEVFSAEEVAVAALGVVVAAAYQVSMPLCPRHAPCLVGAEVKEPSLHFPVVPAGAPAGTCAMRM